MLKESSEMDSGGAATPPPEMKGWLFKWTNYIKGYQKRVVRAWIRREDSLNFVVSNGGGTQTFHLRANTELELQKWLVKFLVQDNPKAEDDSEEEVPQEVEDDFEKRELMNSIKTLASKLETCHKLILKNYSPLQQALDVPLQENDPELKDRIKIIKERSSLFKLASDMLMEASSDFLEHSLSQGSRWQRLLASEREQRLKLEDMVEHMAKHHSQLETQVRNEINDQTDHNHKTHYTSLVSNASSSSSSQHQPISHNQNCRSDKSEGSSDDEEDVFVDAMDDQAIGFTVPVPPGLQMSHPSNHCRTDSDLSNKFANNSDELDDAQDLDRVSNFSCDEDNPSNMQFNVVHRKNIADSKKQEQEDSDTKKSSSVKIKTPVKTTTSIRKRRSRIPNKPDISFSLWSIMKNCIGKDLTKIPVPVNFAEPLSMLQRLVEDFEYSELLDKALLARNDREQMLYVAAFTVSAYSTTAIRVGKPFNPLLGETYECDRSDDKGFRSISEQVSHHPPMVAQYCESTNGSWRYWQEFTMRSKFKGKYLEVEPLGIAHLEFTESGNHFTWRKVKTLVHNFVVGKLWIDQMGEMEIVNHKNWDKCHMKFEPYSYFVGGAKKITGTITSGSTGSVEWVLNGKWDSKFEGSHVLGETNNKGKSSLEIEAPILLWEVNPPSKESDKYYNFSTFACELNELEDDVAPTDSRLRPDQRLMEDGLWDEANTEKIRLEEKQRTVRKARESEAEALTREGRSPEPYTPIWFRKENDPQNGDKLIHIYQGNYWECKESQDWSKCPDIY
ncbi:OSBP [Lepeophtheirus salmonis]|uniref:OSBP n=1 Tax=Lepeophtheirus salmonis TaxID=72036 RepID=A0A7R8CUA6_LEPSM|nr:OSBP [Lepeophtheirus salmonis]CAF2931828.1 OSBP [Lepeophtheirus salmonis]